MEPVVLTPTYDGWYEAPGGRLIPGPGQCHPGLLDVAEFVRETRMSHVRVPLAVSVSASSDTQNFEPNIRSLDFTLSRWIAYDGLGMPWLWWVWTDNLGRSIASELERL